MKLNEEQRDFLIGLLEHTQEKLSIEDSMEYGEVIAQLMDKVNMEAFE